MEFAQAFDPLRSVRMAGTLFRQAPLTVFLGSLLPLALQLALQLPLQFLFPLPFLFGSRPAEEQMLRIFPIVLLASVLVGAASLALSCWIDVGFGRALELALRTGQEQTRTIFSGGDRFWTLVWARVLTTLAYFAVTVPTALGMIVLVVVWNLQIPTVLRLLAPLAVWLGSLVCIVYLYLGFSMVTAIVALEDCSATSAIARSWRLASGNRLRLIWFHLFSFFLSVVGTLACFVGLLVAIPLIETMRYEAYLALTRGAPPVPPPQASADSSAEPRAR